MHFKFFKEDLLGTSLGPASVAVPAASAYAGAAGLKCPVSHGTSHVPWFGRGVSVYPGTKSGLDALVIA